MSVRTLHLAAIAFVVAAFMQWNSFEAQAQYSRNTPVVEAVRKTRPSIVAVKAEKKSASGGSRETVGTGVIVDERGYVVTSDHVVAGAERITVELADGSRLSAEATIEDTKHDLAVLHIRADKKLTALPLGPSSDLMVGETVIAVGHPFGYTNTVSTGIVSAVGREVTMPGGVVLKQLIQTTASINPGNSGGPLLNINGELIGINAAIRDGAQGIAFALNANAVQQVLSRHLSAGKVAGVNHGLSCHEAVEGENGPRQHVVVETVAEQSPAQSAGLRHGDAILQVAGRGIGNRFDLERALWDRKAGENVNLTLVRQGKELTVNLRLGEQIHGDSIQQSGQPTRRSSDSGPSASEAAP